MEFVLMVFLKIFYLGQKGVILSLKMAHPHNFEIHSKVFFEILHSEKGQEVHGNHITGFLKKFSFGANEPFWAQKWRILITLDPL